jgi:hypothetical protein
MGLRLSSLVHAAVAGAALVTSVAAAGAPSHAAPPSRDRGEFTFEHTYAPGELCDVAVHELIVGTFRDIEFSEERSRSHNQVLFTYTNLETGAAMTDRGSFVGHERDGTLAVTGLGTQLRGPDGRNLGIQAGRTVFDVETFEIVSSSGVSVADYEAAVCGALGSEPAG